MPARILQNPGDDFFRYGNGAWYDRARIPPDRSSTGVDTELNITAEARIRDILERGAEGAGPSARADAAKIGAFYTAFMDEAGAEARDAEPIAPLLRMIRAAATREQLAGMMGGGRQSFFSAMFGLGIDPDDKAPTAMRFRSGRAASASTATTISRRGSPRRRRPTMPIWRKCWR